MNRFIVMMLAILMMALSLPAAAQEVPSREGVQLVQIIGDLFHPIFVTHAGDDSGRLFVVQQNGLIRIHQDGSLLETPFLDISDLISPEALGSNYTERGLLGLAFAPDYAESGRFYVNYTDVNGNTVIARYLVSADDANTADENNVQIILTQEQPYSNHNGGHLTFGPDGYLYIGFGDGGSQGDPHGNGQNLETWLGKILRIDVSGEGEGYTVPDDNPFVGDSSALPEIWAYGLRNPWRFSFDSKTGDLYIGDVGGSAYEEINFEAAESAGGLNFGWNAYEGMYQTGFANPPDNVTLPVATYDHSQGVTVIGGYVYHGELLPQLTGVYFYGDWGSSTIWTLWPDANSTWRTAVFIPSYSGQLISSFGVDEDSELLLVDYDGAIYRFEPAG